MRQLFVSEYRLGILLLGVAIAWLFPSQLISSFFCFVVYAIVFVWQYRRSQYSVRQVRSSLEMLLVMVYGLLLYEHGVLPGTFLVLLAALEVTRIVLRAWRTREHKPLIYSYTFPLQVAAIGLGLMYLVLTEYQVVYAPATLLTVLGAVRLSLIIAIVMSLAAVVRHSVLLLRYERIWRSA